MIELQLFVPLSDKTSYKIGGLTRWYAEPRDKDELAEALGRAHAECFPVLVVGKGTNMLVSDHGWPGLALNLSTLMTAIEWKDTTIVVQGGALLDAVVRESVCRGLQGMEDLSGIPGTVGGAVIMNAGAFSTSVADTLHEVVVFDLLSNKVATIEKAGIMLGYRTSLLQKNPAIVLSARFDLHKGTASDLERRRCEVLEQRRKKQPLDLPNCGSVFKRPPDNFAGTLIEKAGLKGMRFGNAQISLKHANFIVNLGHATAAEVRHLIVHAQRMVHEQSGILLEPEVVFAGEFEEPLFTP